MIGNWLELDSHRQTSAMTSPQIETISLAQMERQLIEETLEKNNGHRQKTAQILGIGIRTLGMKLKRWKEQDSEQAAVKQ